MMLRLSSPDERIVAVLHDVCEDCPGWTFDRLRDEGFSDEIIAALDAVTKREGEDYEDFARRAAANPMVETSSWLISRTTAISPALLNQPKLITNASKISAGNQTNSCHLRAAERTLQDVSASPK